MNKSTEKENNRLNTIEKKLSGTGSIILSASIFKIDRSASMSEIMNDIEDIKKEINKIRTVLNYK
jgi:hypothetical protein